jgi:hypothetical protein
MTSLRNKSMSVSREEIETLVEEDMDEDQIMEQRIAAAKATCRQRRIATYVVLTIYVIIAIYYYSFRREKET